MLNSLRRMYLQAPTFSLNPIAALLASSQKHRQAAALRKLDARALSDIGMTEARRDAELRKMLK